LFGGVSSAAGPHGQTDRGIVVRRKIRMAAVAESSFSPADKHRRGGRPMSEFRIVAMPSETAARFRAGGLDANGQPPERHISDGDGVPCRHCLTDVAKGDPFLILAYRRFPKAQPYAEIGPIFLHADACRRYAEASIPAMFLARKQILIRGYGADDRIVYGTGMVIPSGDLAIAATKLFRRTDVAYAHLRSASNNCFQCRLERFE
jgi:hypothetical protein